MGIEPKPTMWAATISGRRAGSSWIGTSTRACLFLPSQSKEADRRRSESGTSFTRTAGRSIPYTMGRYIGCYPTSLFAPKGVNPRNMLATAATNNLLYGEVSSSDERFTTTDMGVGRPASDGWKYAASMRKMKWIDTNGQEHDWSGFVHADDPARYAIEPRFQSGMAGWNSYMYLGGSGAGSVDA